MKTLILYGSARKNGRTKDIIDLIVENLEGEVEIIDAYQARKELSISACIDCRYCWRFKGCNINDDMQNIYSKINSADNIIIASPVYYHSITSELKAIIERFQMYYCGRVRGDFPTEFMHKGAYILVGGSPKFDNQFIGSEMVCKGALADISCKIVGHIEFSDSDNVKVKNNRDIINKCRILTEKLNAPLSSS